MTGARLAVSGLFLGLLLVGCARGPLSPPEGFDGAKWDIDRVEALDLNPDPYFGELQSRAIDLAKAERAEFDWIDTAYFVTLAAQAQRGELRQPVNPQERPIDPDMAQLLVIPFVELTGFVNSEGGRLRAGTHLGAAQAYFECWVQELEEGHQEGDIAGCQDLFETQMQIVRLLAPLPGDLAVVLSEGGGVEIDAEGRITTLDRPFAAGSTAADGGDVMVTEAEIREAFAAALGASPPPPVRFVITFEFNEFTLDEEDLGTIDKAVSTALERPHAEIIITGHSDAPGSARQNVLMSLQRAQTVRDEVLSVITDNSPTETKLTVPKAAFRGDKDKLVDSQRQEAENRRVEILVR